MRSKIHIFISRQTMNVSSDLTFLDLKSPRILNAQKLHKYYCQTQDKLVLSDFVCHRTLLTNSYCFICCKFGIKVNSMKRKHKTFCNKLSSSLSPMLSAFILLYLAISELDSSYLDQHVLLLVWGVPSLMHHGSQLRSLKTTD